MAVADVEDEDIAVEGSVVRALKRSGLPCRAPQRQLDYLFEGLIS